MDVCFIQFQIEIDLSLAGILLSVDTFFMVGISYFMFRESITPMKIAAMFIGFFGYTLVMNLYSDSGTINLADVLHGLGPGMFGFIYAAGLKITMNDSYRPYTVLFFMFLIGSITYIPMIGYSIYRKCPVL